MALNSYDVIQHLHDSGSNAKRTSLGRLHAQSLLNTFCPKPKSRLPADDFPNTATSRQFFKARLEQRYSFERSKSRDKDRLKMITDPNIEGREYRSLWRRLSVSQLSSPEADKKPTQYDAHFLALVLIFRVQLFPIMP